MWRRVCSYTLAHQTTRCTTIQENDKLNIYLRQNVKSQIQVYIWIVRNIWHIGVNKVNDTLKICWTPARPIILCTYSPPQLHLAPRLRMRGAILLRHLVCLYGVERECIIFTFTCCYCSILGKREDSRSWSRKNSIVLSGEFALEEAMKPSHDVLRE